jgi:hypothetical protein
MFDRERTRSILGLNHDVPLIRIPHLVDTTDLTETTLSMWRRRFQTVFFFESLDERLLNDEITALDSGWLLFLNHLQRVALSSEESDRAFNRSFHVANGRRFAVIGDGSTQTT